MGKFGKIGDGKCVISGFKLKALNIKFSLS